MDSNSELEDVLNWEVEILTVPTQVARRLLHRNNGAEEREVLAEVAGCVHIRTRMTEGSETHQASVTIKIGDRQAVRAMSRMLAVMEQDMRNGVVGTMYDVRKEGERRKVMEGDMGPRIISYLDDEDSPNVACTNRYYAAEIHEARNTQEAFVYSSEHRLQRVVNMLQAKSGDMDKRGQVDMEEAEQYGDIEVADNDCSVRQ